MPKEGFQEMTSIASSWKAIGIGLRIGFGRLETIQNGTPEHVCHQCLPAGVLTFQ